MDTSGHEKVAETAGIPLLQEAFQADSDVFQAFYLGNWLTDVSQFVDPVAYECGLAKAETLASEVIDKAVATVFRRNEKTSPDSAGFFESMSHILEIFAEDAKRSLLCDIEVFALLQANPRESPIAKFFRDAFFVIGYFKFVHPSMPGGGQKMDFSKYVEVFNGTNGDAENPGAFTQYLPVEHIDRPEVRLCTGEYAQLPEQGGPRGTRSERRRESLFPDVYPYVRDAIEMAAGLLVEVDGDIGAALSGNLDVSSNDGARMLAKLGHALHVIEDFFAHSNWTELAIQSLGTSAFNRILPPKLPFDVLNRSRTMFAQRLKRYQPDGADDWSKLPDENWVVTGYFDGIDAFFSLSHAAEELFGFNPTDPVGEVHQVAQKTTLDEARKFFRDSLQLLTNPTRAFEDPENKAAESLKNEYGDKIHALMREPLSDALANKILENTSIFRDLESSSRKDVYATSLRVLVEGSRLLSVGQLSIKLFELLQNVAELVANPAAWIVRRFVPEFLRERLQDAVAFYTRDLVYQQLGGYRIGCHTLMAKDHDDSFLYDEQFNCATAVHWYVVKTLLRHKDKPEKRESLDWLELLEHFLRNPIGMAQHRKEVISITKEHVISERQQLKAADPNYSLEAIFKKTAVDPSRFSWRSIADENFGTYGLPLKQAQRVINDILKERSWGVPVRSPNYAFKTGIVIRIPDQKYEIGMCEMLPEGKKWFFEVLSGGDWKKTPEYQHYKAFPAFDSFLANPSDSAHKPIVVSATDANAIAQRGRFIRRKAIDSYRSTEIPAKQRPKGSCASNVPMEDDIEEKIRSAKAKASKADAGLLERITIVRKALQATMPAAAHALDHYLRGSGQSVRIHQEYAAYVRQRSEPHHRDALIRLLKDATRRSAPASAARLALDALTVNQTVLPTAEWPMVYSFPGRPFRFANALSEDASSVIEQAITHSSPEWLVTYFNAEIASRVEVRATRVGGTRQYEFEVLSWESWVVDNYDWNSSPHEFGKGRLATDLKKALEYDTTGRKRYGGVLGGFVGIPSNAEMRRLELLIGARPYSRSSSSWQADTSGLSWRFTFSDDGVVKSMAKSRAELEARQRLEMMELSTQRALPVPDAFEE